MIAPIKNDGPKNVLGKELVPCCLENRTGWYRNGSCETDSGDQGRHVVCALMTEEFLEFSKVMGNDLSTPMPEYDFPGLKEEIAGVYVPAVGRKHSRLAWHPRSNWRLAKNLHLTWYSSKICKTTQSDFLRQSKTLFIGSSEE